MKACPRHFVLVITGPCSTSCRDVANRCFWSVSSEVSIHAWATFNGPRYTDLGHGGGKKRGRHCARSLESEGFRGHVTSRYARCRAHEWSPAYLPRSWWYISALVTCWRGSLLTILSKGNEQTSTLKKKNLKTLFLETPVKFIPTCCSGLSAMMAGVCDG